MPKIFFGVVFHFLPALCNYLHTHTHNPPLPILCRAPYTFISIYLRAALLLSVCVIDHRCCCCSIFTAVKANGHIILHAGEEDGLSIARAAPSSFSRRTTYFRFIAQDFFSFSFFFFFLAIAPRMLPTAVSIDWHRYPLFPFRDVRRARKNCTHVY